MAMQESKWFSPKVASAPLEEGLQVGIIAPWTRESLSMEPSSHTVFPSFLKVLDTLCLFPRA